METTQENADVLAVEPDGIPQELKTRPQWVVWRQTFIDGRWTKIPYIAGGVGKASTTDLMTWRSFEEAVHALDNGRYDGLGFVFCSGDGFVGIDLDDCRDPETGEVEEWAAAVISRFDEAHVEASPSGKGVHIIARGRLREGKRRGRVEMYGQERFFTITGVRV
jgi:putative DNA primase/helicase